MALFDAFRQPKWQHKNPQKRLQAITGLDDPQILQTLVCEDADPAVQLAALAKISQASLLDELLARKLPAAVLSQARAQRLRLLLPQPEALATVNDEVALLHIIQLSEDTDLTAAAINRIGSETTLARLAREHAQARTRLHAAQQIKDPELISQLMHDSRGHDKAVYRYCKSVVDEKQAAEQKSAKQQETLQRLMSRMAELAKAQDSPVYEGQYRSLLQEWRGVEAAASPEQKASFQEHQAVCGQRLIEQRDARLEAAKSQAEQEEARLQFKALLQRLDEMEAALVVPSDPEALQAFEAGLNELQQQSHEAASAGPVPNDVQTPFKARLQRLQLVASTARKLLEKSAQANALIRGAGTVDSRNYSALDKHIAALQKFLGGMQWPEGLQLQQPSVVGDLQAGLHQLQEQLRSLEQEQQKLVKRGLEWVENISQALEQQQPGEADKTMAKARSLLVSLAAKPREQLEQQLAPLSARLREFHDWQNFAIEPKKHALCERMEALVGQDGDIELLALNIQTLQAEWKQLGQLPHAREQELWTRFKAAADEAWKPCQQEFDQQAAIRRQNFEQRMQLVKQLESYEQRMQWPENRTAGEASGPAPDWPLVQKTLDTARAAFRELGPVDAKAERTSQKAFKEICDRVYGHISAEYQRNIERKQDLLARAQKLAGQADLQQAISLVKVLQADWTATGITPVAVDRKLWKEFRAACDAVFARLDQQRRAEKEEADAQVQMAESLRDQASKLLDNPEPANLAHLPREIAELIASLDEISLPPPVHKALKKQMQAMQSQAKELLTQQHREAERQAWARVAELMRAAVSGTVSEIPGELASELPRGVDAGLMQAFLEHGPVEANDESSREACIALEVLAGIESPDEDRQARMNYQLGRLAQGLGQKPLDTGQELLECINAFIALRPAARWVTRFCNGLHKIRG